MQSALAALDRRLTQPTKLLIGGGAAMLLAHGFPVSTMDIDGLVFQSAITQAELDPLVKAVAVELHIPRDWLNSYFNTFLYTLPKDYAARLKEVYQGAQLRVYALGAADLCILKCFAGRPKDIPHARALLRIIADCRLVERHLQTMVERNIPGAQAAIDRFDELRDALGRD